MKRRIATIFAAALALFALPARADWTLAAGNSDNLNTTMTDGAGHTLKVTVLSKADRTLRIGQANQTNTSPGNSNNATGSNTTGWELDFSQPIRLSGAAEDEKWTIVEIAPGAFFNNKVITNPATGLDRSMLAWGSRRKLERMTSREGLKIALYHADFALARMFARRILDVAPEDPAANFAIGMDFFVQRQYVRAQAYLERCLEQRPDDPAVLNNIAQCMLRRNDPKGALPYAERAKAILPDSPEIGRTFKRVKAALAEEGRKTGKR